MTEEQVARYLRARSYGARVRDAARYAGVHRATIYVARDTVPGFRDRELDAEDTGAVRVGGAKRKLPRTLDWPQYPHVRSVEDFYCSFCGDDIEVGMLYRTYGVFPIHEECAVEQSMNYDTLQALLRGEL